MLKKLKKIRKRSKHNNLVLYRFDLKYLDVASNTSNKNCYTNCKYIGYCSKPLLPNNPIKLSDLCNHLKKDKGSIVYCTTDATTAISQFLKKCLY